MSTGTDYDKPHRNPKMPPPPNIFHETSASRSRNPSKDLREIYQMVKPSSVVQVFKIRDHNRYRGRSDNLKCDPKTPRFIPKTFSSREKSVKRMLEKSRKSSV